MFYKRLILTVIILYTLSVPAAAQSTQQTSNDELKAKAFSLLESLSKEVSALQSAENRARIASNLVDSLWSHDEQKARTMVEMIKSDLNTVLQSPPSEDASDRLTYMVFMKLRLDSVERISKYDPALALDFLNSTKPAWAEPLPLYGDSDVVNQTQLQLARKLADKNPEATLRLGREILERGFSSDLIEVMQVLGRKHKDQAQVLYRETVAKLRKIDPVKEWNASNFIASLAYSIRPPVISEASVQEFMSMLKTVVASMNCTSTRDEDYQIVNFCQGANNLTQSLTRAKLDRGRDPYNSNNEDAYREVSQLLIDRTIDEALALLPEYPNQATMIYLYAVNSAAFDGDYERARKIAVEFKGDPDFRERIMQEIDELEKSDKIDTEKIMSNLFAKFDDLKLPARVLRLVRASNAIGRSDRKASLKLLRQAHDIAESIKPGRDKSMALIHLAAGYCLEKDARGFAIIESLLPQLNEVVTASMKLDGFEANYVRDGEWSMTGAGSVGDLLTKLSEYSGSFAWCDFDKAVNMAGSFERPEIRMMGQLKLAQSILNGPPKRARFGLPGAGLGELEY